MSSLEQGALNALPESRIDAEYFALRNGAGIVPLADRLLIRAIGSDRVAFMHGMCSQDVKGLATGAVAPALILNERAHLIADLFLYAEPDALLIEIDRRLWPAARDHLERLLVADDVEFQMLGETAVLDLEGPLSARAATAVAGANVADLAEWRHVAADGLAIANLPRYGTQAYSIIASRTIIDNLSARILGATDRPEAARVAPETLEIIRVENGRARVGIDTNEKTIALEARLERAISFSKGCYVGQETIERATARGGIRKKLFGLRIAGERAPAPGAAVIHQEKEVGRLTSIVRSPRFGAIGLAIIHQQAWTPGAMVAVHADNGEFSGIVSELPFQ